VSDVSTLGSVADRAAIVEALAELLLEALDDEDRRDDERREEAHKETPRDADTSGARPDGRRGRNVGHS
jgi:hypothetical protein